MAALRDEPGPLADQVSGIPAALEAIVVHCLEKRAEDWFQSARDMAFALRAVAGPTGASAVRRSHRRSRPRSGRARS